MTIGLRVPSIRAVRSALAEVPGALRYEPLPEDSRGGIDPGSEIWPFDPDRRTSQLTLDSPNDDDGEEDVLIDEPAVIFEVPPQLTDSDIRNVLGDGLIEEIKRLEQVRGSDALAWYLTFHQTRFQHGVYIPVEGILYLVVTALIDLPVSIERAMQLAFHAILRHEIFHFATDCMIANWELATGSEVYWKAKVQWRNAIGYVELEEALANAYMLRGFKHPSRILAKSGGASAALRNFCTRQPAGYKDGPEFARNRPKYVEGCRDLARIYQHASDGWDVPGAMDAFLLYPDPVRIDWSRCPIIIQDRLGIQKILGIQIDYFQAVTDVEPTREFEKSFKKLDRTIQRQWQKRVSDLAESTSLGGLDFKQWKKAGPDIYSVRVNSNFRAHLRYDRERLSWTAIAIGNHDQMGH